VYGKQQLKIGALPIKRHAYVFSKLSPIVVGTLYLSNQFAFSNIFQERNQRHIQFTFISQKNEIAETYASFKMPQAVKKQLNKIFVIKARQTRVLVYASCNCFNLVYLVL